MATGSGTGTIVGDPTSTAYEQLQGIRSKFRIAAGIPTSDTDTIDDDTIDILINDFYRTVLPNDITSDVFESDFTQAITAVDSGEYSLSATILEVLQRATFNHVELDQYYDKNAFFEAYPSTEHTIETATILSIGVSSTSAITNSAFQYIIAGKTYLKATAETELSGDTVPQSKYGAWMLTIDADGTFTVTPAGDNATGYNTAALAMQAIPNASEAAVGYITVINTGATFVPGTTSLSTGGTVTATYTDGNPNLRSKPLAFLIDGRKLFIRPKSDDNGLFRSKLMVQAPSDLSSDTASVFNELWGNAIAIGVAAEYWNQRGDIEKAAKLTGSSSMSGTYQFYITRINRTWYRKNKGRNTTSAL